MASRLPSLFVSHGAPTLAIDDSPARHYLERLGPALGKPSAIIVVSAHWETAVPTVGPAAEFTTIHDFSGFPRALYEVDYPAKGDPALAGRVAELLRRAGISVEEDARRGLDHGAWVPLTLMYPDADVPVVPLSIQPGRDPAHHEAIGRALAPLREEGVLILASGSATHNLMEFRGQSATAEPPEWVVSFADWLHHAVEEGRSEDLLDYRARAPHAVRNHPTDEHLLPLFAALGAAEGQPGHRLHGSHRYGILAMDVYGFDGDCSHLT
ncbi:class III extradiol ring-cleavage dioxygenase [Inquilinus sp. CAU 1745]|uniref:DODA-type extradiol aromatic ring-opening family dioxygenase n=1 Tax=Inquilinus sp. CAU 1745 TaxID=3140369 RepID=UPI00325B3906